MITINKNMVSVLTDKFEDPYWSNDSSALLIDIVNKMYLKSERLVADVVRNEVHVQIWNNINEHSFR